MELRELLSIPYLLEAEAVETESGRWLVRLSYPELTDCSAEGSVVEDALQDLERRRIELITNLVERGEQPPIPRSPLASSDPLWTARQLGLAGPVVALLASPSKNG